MIKMILWYLPFLFLINFNLQGKTTFEEYAQTQDNAASPGALVYDKKGGTTTNDSHIIYVPVSISTNHADRLLHSYLEELITIDSTLSLKPRINISFSHDEGGGKSLFVAAKKSENNFVVIMDDIPTDTGVETLLEIPISDLCSFGDCTLDTYSSGEVNAEQLIYVFAANENAFAVDQTVDTSNENYNDGVYITLKFSSKYDSAGIAGLTSIGKGDAQLRLNYNAGTADTTIMVNSIHKVFSFNYGNNPQGSLTFKDAINVSPAPSLAEHLTQGAGTLTVTGLNNGETYHMAVALMNKYQFITKTSPSMAATPLELETFLREQSCFLLSAGFQKRHYVLDYFRHFRDSVLLKFSWGQKFVSWYYEWAPPLAPYIYNNEGLSAVVRGLAFTLYFLMVNFLPLMVSVILIGVGLTFRKFRSSVSH